MSLLRFLARSLVASAFIADGVQKVSHPDDSAADAERFTAAVTPLVQRVVPSGYSSWVPEEPASWVRVSGAAEIVGGVMFATGIGRRLGALLLAKASILNVAIALPGKDASRDAKQAARPRVLTHLALLGSTVLAAQDLQGRPSLAWRAGQGIHKADKKLSHTQDDLSRKARKAGKQAKRKAHKLGKKLESVVQA